MCQGICFFNKCWLAGSGSWSTYKIILDPDLLLSNAERNPCLFLYVLAMNIYKVPRVKFIGAIMAFPFFVTSSYKKCSACYLQFPTYRYPSLISLIWSFFISATPNSTGTGIALRYWHLWKIEDGQAWRKCAISTSLLRYQVWSASRDVDPGLLVCGFGSSFFLYVYLDQTLKFV